MILLEQTRMSLRANAHLDPPQQAKIRGHFGSWHGKVQAGAGPACHNVAGLQRIAPAHEVVGDPGECLKWMSEYQFSGPSTADDAVYRNDDLMPAEVEFPPIGTGGTQDHAAIEAV